MFLVSFMYTSCEVRTYEWTVNSIPAANWPQKDSSSVGERILQAGF